MNNIKLVPRLGFMARKYVYLLCNSFVITIFLLVFFFRFRGNSFFFRRNSFWGYCGYRGYIEEFYENIRFGLRFLTQNVSISDFRVVCFGLLRSVTSLP